jgi:hypothetical protein
MVSKLFDILEIILKILYSNSSKSFVGLATTLEHFALNLPKERTKTGQMSKSSYLTRHNKAINHTLIALQHSIKVRKYQ